MKYPQLVSMPSAVSDWLEEQLEARGIDAVVYTRYVLSLLHSHTVDVIHADEDLHFTSHLKKEVRRSGGGRKRFCRSSDWWKIAHADAEQLKRSAAVQCLMSASEQSSGIESLVDELCEKLKGINSETTLPTETTLKSNELQKVSAKDLAEQYYAAFPPLCRKKTTTSSSPAKLISLIPKWIPSPKKRNTRKQSHHHHNHRSYSYEDKFRFKVDNDNMKARTTGKRCNYYCRNKKDLDFCRNMAKSVERSEGFNDWDICTFNNNNGNSKNRAISNWTFGKESVTSTKNNTSLTHVPVKSDQCVSTNQEDFNEEELNMYEDLPVDIRELLDSPTPQEESVDMMNLANMRDTGKKDFIQYGTNIMSSIWSNDAVMEDTTFDNTFNTALDAASVASSDSLLDFKFRSIYIDKNNVHNNWPPTNTFLTQNERNTFLENQKNTYKSFSDLPDPDNNSEKWSEIDCFQSDEQYLNQLAMSLMKINHNKEKSSFTEIISKPKSLLDPLINKENLPIKFNARVKDKNKKDDLLTSLRSHFYPINVYADGTMFHISDNLDKVNYKRSESGTRYLETEEGTRKKYYEYHFEDENITEQDLEIEFILKYSVCQNDKACQTDDGDRVDDIDCDHSSTILLGCEYDPVCIEPYKCISDSVKCTCPSADDLNAMKNDYSFETNFTNCLVHPNRPDSMISEVMWKYDKKTCENCNNNSFAWNTDWLRNAQIDSEWDNMNLRNIWSGGEVCHTCLSIKGGRPPPSQQHSQLREDISQDGEQLLSDLSSLQKSYMDELPIMDEFSYNISEIFAPKDRKRHHSFIASHLEDMDAPHRGSWSFASRLEEDCLIQMSTIPTLRSVTL